MRLTTDAILGDRSDDERISNAAPVGLPPPAVIRALDRHVPVTPEFLRISRHRAVWVSTVLATVAIILWFALTTDLSAFTGVFEQAGPGALLITVSCMVINAILVVSWLMLIAGHQATLPNASRVAAWQMLASTILPARLGDLAWMYFIHRWLGFGGGQAVFVALYHRLQDFIVVSGLFVLGIIVVGAQALGADAGLAIGVLLALLIGIIFSLDRLLTQAALLLQRLDEAFGVAATRLAYRHALQIRVWYRHNLKPPVLWGSFAIIVVRWAIILLGMSVLIHAAAPQVDWLDSLFASIAYVLMAIVPLQAFGGFGVGEAGLAWLLTFYGVDLATASSIGLVIRLLTNVVHLAIYLLVSLALNISRTRPAAVARS